MRLGIVFYLLFGQLNVLIAQEQAETYSDTQVSCIRTLAHLNANEVRARQTRLVITALTHKLEQILLHQSLPGSVTGQSRSMWNQSFYNLILNNHAVPQDGLSVTLGNLMGQRENSSMQINTDDVNTAYILDVISLSNGSYHSTTNPSPILAMARLLEQLNHNPPIVTEEQRISTLANFNDFINHQLIPQLCPAEGAISYLACVNPPALIPEGAPDRCHVPLSTPAIDHLLSLFPIEATTPFRSINAYRPGADSLSMPFGLAVNIPNYPLNSAAYSTTCFRPMDMVDTIVLHHTGTWRASDPLRINQNHIEGRDPNVEWLMIGYHYIISGSIAGSDTENDSPTVYQGRPLHMVGAHSGGNIIGLTPQRRRELQSYSLVCNYDQGFGTTPVSMTDRSFYFYRGRTSYPRRFSDEYVRANGEINSNITTIGIAAMGNYGRVSLKHGVPVSRGGRRRTAQPSVSLMKKIAQLSCSIQKLYPNVRKIRSHSEYKSTFCPGTIRSNISTIKEYAKEYGCDFD